MSYNTANAYSRYISYLNEANKMTLFSSEQTCTVLCDIIGTCSNQGCNDQSVVLIKMVWNGSPVSDWGRRVPVSKPDFTEDPPCMELVAR
ncbi:hypothetical protein AVEN_173459-1 [Araneus ventricosus]|uniref:Uncharacterized protein n=1 Tax=Araneus ventricosus TaxID=182803 RepID=A0A4Y2KX03_ARAVE|nr:hypothetical protein AVEN_173459-1 [Araneus ventricosus]